MNLKILSKDQVIEIQAKNETTIQELKDEIYKKSNQQ